MARQRGLLAVRQHGSFIAAEMSGWSKMGRRQHGPMSDALAGLVMIVKKLLHQQGFNYCHTDDRKCYVSWDSYDFFPSIPTPSFWFKQDLFI